MTTFAGNAEKLSVAPGTDTLINGGFLKGLSPADNTLASVKALFVNDAEKISAYNGGTALSDGDRIGTGTVIKLTDGSSVKDSVVAILYGDVNGDGFITEADYDLIVDEAAGISDSIENGSVYEKAADVNNDTVIDAFDLSLIDLQVSDNKDIDQRGDLPEAILSEIDVNTVGENGTVVINNEPVAFDTAYELDATQSLDKIKGKEYKDWNVDIVIFFNKDVDGSKVYLAGQYGSYDWRGNKLSDGVITAGTRISIINGWLGEHLTYTDVIEYVQSLRGAMYVEDAPEMLKVTCELVMTDTDTGDEYVVYAYDHIFNLTLPEAIIEEIDASVIGAGGDGMLTGAVTGNSVRADAGLRLSTDDTPADVIGKDYRFWTVDILVSFDRDVNGNDVYFFGDYGTYEWVGDKLAVVPAFDGTISAGTEIALIGDWISSVIGQNVLVTYDEIVKLVQSMETAVSVPNAEDGLKLTAKLVMTDNESGESYTVSVLDYTFDKYLPEANINTVLADTVGEDNDGFLTGYYSGDNIGADAALSYSSKETYADVEGKKCLDFAVDFEVSFDRDVNGSDVYLFGNYGPYGWIGDKLSVVPAYNGTIAANTPIGIVTDLVGPSMNRTLIISYRNILTEVGEMKTAIHVENPEEGLTVTVNLVMTDLATGDRHTVSTYEYTYITPELPKPKKVSQISNKNFGTNGSMVFEGETVKADAVVRYVSNDTAASIADKDYKDWDVDFLISFNRAVDGSKVFLFGKYGAYDWTGGRLSNGMIESGKKIAVMKSWRGETIPYSAVVELNTFFCAIDVVNPPSGLMVTLQLVITNPETGTRYVVNTFTYDF
jgi:hypothetical protein